MVAVLHKLMSPIQLCAFDVEGFLICKFDPILSSILIHSCAFPKLRLSQISCSLASTRIRAAGLASGELPLFLVLFGQTLLVLLREWWPRMVCFSKTHNNQQQQTTNIMLGFLRLIQAIQNRFPQTKRLHDGIEPVSDREDQQQTQVEND